jgi:uncharacterized membrane protein
LQRAHADDDGPFIAGHTACRRNLGGEYVRKNRPPPIATGAYRDVRRVEDVTAHNVRSIVELDEAARANQRMSERLAQAVASFCGSVSFLWINAGFFTAWMLLNSIPGFLDTDPFPFTFLTLVVSLEAIFLSIFILISQNAENRLTERRNALNLQIDLLSEQENTKMLRMLERIAQKVGVELGDEQALAALEQATRPEKLAEQIDSATGS